MADININEYVRTKNGYIIKYKDNLNTNIFTYDDDLYIENSLFPDEEQIVNHSFNKIDLLQVGDLIRFKELRIFTYNFGTSFYSNYISEIHSKEELENIKKEIKNKKIRLLGIITKEQFSNIEYRLED